MNIKEQLEADLLGGVTTVLEELLARIEALEAAAAPVSAGDPLAKPA